MKTQQFYKTIFLFILIILTGCKEKSPSETFSDHTWFKTYGELYDDICTSAIHNSQNGYTLVGDTYPFGKSGSVIFLLMADSSGNSLNTYFYHEKQDNQARQVIETPDNGYLIIASTETLQKGDATAYIIKTDKDGAYLWSKVYNGKLDNYANAAVTTNKGNYVIVGNSNVSTTGNSEIYIVKVNGNGNVLWSRTYGGIANEKAQSICLTSRNTFLIAGTFLSYSKHNLDIFVMEVNNSGDSLWAKTFGTKSNTFVNSMIKTAKGEYVIVGWTCIPKKERDMYIAKINDSGDLLWERTFGGKFDDVATSALETEAGYIISGYTSSFGQAIPYYNNIILLKLNKRGKIICKKVEGGAGNDRAYTLAKTNTNALVVAGFTQTLFDGLDAFLLKLDFRP